MPVIPQFDQALPIPQPARLPQAPIDLLSAPGAALQRVGAQVEAVAGDFAQRYADARRTADASKILATGYSGLGASQDKWTKVPDQVAAVAGYRGDVERIRAEMLAANDDPFVQATILHHFNTHAALREEDVRHGAFQTEYHQNRGQLTVDLGGMAQNAATASSDAVFAQIAGTAHGMVGSHVAAGWATPAEGAGAESTMLRTAILLRAETDPATAQRWLDMTHGSMAAHDVLAVSEHIRPKLVARQGMDWAAARVAGTSAATPLGLPEAIHQVESSGGADPSTSPAGAIGGWQVMPDTFAQYAQPGEDIHNPKDNEAVGRRIIADLSSRFGGDPARVAVGYFSGPGNVAPPGSPTPWKEDRKDALGETTSGYVRKVLGAMGTGGQAYPDESAMVREALAEPDPDLRAAKLSHLTQILHQTNLVNATERETLTRTLADTVAALEAGRSDVTMPLDRIRAVFPPPQAEQMVQTLQIARRAGQLYASVQWAGPAEIERTRADLAQQSGATEFRLNQHVLAHFDALVNARTKALTDDPAGYVAGNPLVQTAAQAIDPARPETQEAYARTVHAVQTTLGVPEERQHVLTLAQAQQSVQRLTAADPGKEDAGASLDALARSYGAAWPQVFGDLVTLGRLPGDYHILAAMDAPAQAVARQDLQRALTLRTQKGGMQKLTEDAPPDAAKTIAQGLDDALAPFRATTIDLGLINTVRDAIKTLALYRAVRGQDPDPTRAAADIIGAKYDISGTLRAPKGQLAAVQAAAQRVQDGLTPAGLRALPDATGLRTPEETAAETLHAAQRGVWMANENDTGAVLMLRLRDGAMIPAQRPDGSRIEIRFNALPQPQAAAPAAAGSGQTAPAYRPGPPNMPRPGMD